MRYNGVVSYTPVAKVVRKLRLGEEPKDVYFWRSRSYAERLAALEEIRREYHAWKYDAEPRFQRVYKVTKRT